MPKLSSSKNLFYRRLSYIIGGLVILALISQSLLIKQLYDRTEQLKTQELKAVLIDASRSLNVELAVDPRTGQQFIPASRVVLPAKLESHVYYRSGGDDSTVWVIDANNQSQAAVKVRTAESMAGIFNELQNLQMCSRQVVISFSAARPQNSNDKLTLITTKKLKDGRTAYIYQNECPYGAEPLLRSVNQLESF